MKRRIKKYFRVWWLMSRNSFIAVLANRNAAFVFLLGKLFRFFAFIFFIIFLLKGTSSLAGYNLNQTVFFFLVFSLVDTVSQFLFRHVYSFRQLVVKGTFDMILCKPINPLFRSLLGGADIIDLITIPPLIVALVLVAGNFHPTLGLVLLFFPLILNALLIAAAFHILILSLGIITMETDHSIMMYRDLTSFGRFPIDIYKEPVKGILTYLVPVGIMISIPSKALMGMVSFGGVMISFLVGIALIFISIKVWNFALKKYSGASG